MSAKLKILHLEDSQSDSELIARLLADEGIGAEITRCDGRDAFIKTLREGPFDLIFADCTLPQFDGLSALEMARRDMPQTPFIFVSGTLEEDVAIESLRRGATDYVLKHRLSRLGPAVRRAIAERRARIQNEEMEQRLLQAQRLEAVGTLAGGIAHDFNNILTIIRTFTSQLPLECTVPDRVCDIAKVIDRASSRGTELVSELMAFARKSESTFASTDINLRLREIVAMLRPTLPSNVEIELKLADGLPEIPADAGQIERVVINLATNARDAMPDGGRITVSTLKVRYEETPPAPNTANKVEHYVRLRVSDNGTGMDEATRQRIFEPFFTTKPLGKGTGLGLPVVYGLVQSHHGLIDVQSKLGKGTDVSLFFPAPATPMRAAQGPVVEAPVSLDGTETILLVDDEGDLRYFVEMMLSLHGYKVIAASDGHSALEAMPQEAGKVQVLFSDVGLPMMDGFELAQRVRAIHPQVKTVLCSGFSDQKLKAKMTEEGIDKFVAKPYDSETLLTAIRTTLDKSAASKAAH